MDDLSCCRGGLGILSRRNPPGRAHYVAEHGGVERFHGIETRGACGLWLLLLLLLAKYAPNTHQIRDWMFPATLGGVTSTRGQALSTRRAALAGSGMGLLLIASILLLSRELHTEVEFLYFNF